MIRAADYAASYDSAVVDLLQIGVDSGRPAEDFAAMVQGIGDSVSYDDDLLDAVTWVAPFNARSGADIARIARAADSVLSYDSSVATAITIATRSRHTTDSLINMIQSVGSQSYDENKLTTLRTLIARTPAERTDEGPYPDANEQVLPADPNYPGDATSPGDF